MMKYRAQDGDRLDSIIYKIYGTLEDKVIKEVLRVNKHLLIKALLDANDIVYLPDIEINIETSQTKALW